MPLRTNYIPESKRHLKANERRAWQITAVHEKKGIEIIQDFIRIFKPELILELGTSWGGLTAALYDASPDVDLFTYDKKSQTRTPHNFIKTNPKIHICFCDLLKEPYDRLLLKLEEDKKKILYCDNGNKIKEALWYGSKLKIGDVLGMHDWPGEVNFDWNKLDVHHREKNSPEEVKQFKEMIDTKFKSILYDQFVENKCSTRLWERIK